MGLSGAPAGAARPAPRATLPAAELREGLVAGLVLGLAELLATGPWRIPLALAGAILAADILGGLVSGLLARLARAVLPGPPHGLATALALLGAVLLQGVSVVSKDLGGAPLLYAAAAAIALLDAAGARLAARRGAPVLLALVLVPAAALVPPLAGAGADALLPALLLPGAVALGLALLPPRAGAAASVVGGALVALLLPLPVLLLDSPPREPLPPPRAAQAAPAGAPSIVLVVVDTLRADAVDWCGPEGRTPGLARLAADGVRFDQAIASAPWTLPSVSSLLTGLLPTQHGACDRRHALPGTVETLAERLHAAGWETVAFTGGAFVDPAFGLAQGFEHFDAHAEYVFRPLRVYVPLAWRVAKNRYWPQRWLLRRVEEYGGAPLLRARVARWLERRDPSRPFFLLVHTYEVHDYYVYRPRTDDPVLAEAGPPPPRIGSRLTVRPEELFRFSQAELDWFRRIYDARLADVDGAFDGLLRSVEAAVPSGRLVEVVTADHGEGFDAARGRVHHGGRLDDGLLRIPLVLRAPGRLPAGRVVPQQVPQVAIAPTLLDLAGLAPGEGLAGSSLLPALAGQAPFPPEAWSEEHMAGPRWLSLREPPWKEVDDGHGHRRYDLSKDPHEDHRVEPAGDDPLGAEWARFDALFHPRESEAAHPDAGVRDQLHEIGYGD